MAGWSASRSLVLLAPLVLLAGCGSGDLSTGPQDGEVLLQGSSSSFASLAYWRWFNQLAVQRSILSDLAVMGSGESIHAFLTDRVDFAGTDSAPTAVEIRSARRGLLAFPVTAGAIAVAYNLPGCDLRLTRARLVEVFRGRFHDFSQLGCRPQPIRLLHRSDASGSTANLTATLAAFSPQWRRGPGVGRLVNWPAGQGVTGSDGMAEALEATPGSIGYLESSFVRAPLQVAALQSRHGPFLRPTPAAAAEALTQIQLDPPLLGQNPDPARGYPIVNINWMLVPRTGLKQKAESLRTSLSFILSQDGQDDAELLGYVPLPSGLRQRGLQQLSALRP